MEMKKYKLGDILELQRGYDLPHSEMEKGNVPVAGSSGIIGYHSISKIDPPCITIGRSGSVGKLFFYNEAIWPHNTSLYIKNFKNNNEKYIFYLLKTVDFERLCDSSVVPSLNRNFVYPIKVPFYDNVADQQKITAVLSSLDDKIALNNRINAKLEQMAKRLYDYWFVQFDFPVSTGSNTTDGKPYKSNGGKMVWNEELKREIPEGWEVKKLDKVLSIKNGKDHKELHDGNYPVFGTGGIMRYVDEFLYSGESILLPRKGSLDNLMYVNDTFWTIDTMFYTEVLLLNGAKYLFYYIDGSNYLNLESGTGRPSMTASAYYSIDVIVPNENVLLNFNEIMKSFEKKKSEVIKENQKLTAMRDKLLPLLMNGQVVVE